MILVAFVHPDPKEIGMNLERYPDYVPLPKLRGRARSQFNSWDLLRRVPTPAGDRFQLRRPG